ncbi:MAG TPA: RDD family protein [Bryobacteraceae bacterium]|nr:RDD family protein [Bryobacteraceae bacterium]
MRIARINTLQLKTPEGIVFSLPLAGPVSRFLAWSVDQACILAATNLIREVLRGIGVFTPGLASAAFVIAYFAISIGYGIAMEWYWRGQTLGKRVLGLRVMDEQALRLEFSQIVVRNLLRFADALPAMYLVGGIACTLSRKFQRLGDLAANTIVVRNLETAQPNLEQILGGKFNSLLEHRHLAARLRQRISPPMAAVALEALLRRDEFQPPARLQLFADLAGHFRELVAFPTEAVEQLSDEQYVRNVVEILYR